MSTTDERKIPKIVLKIGGGSGSRTENSNLQESENLESIFSTKASELAKEFFIKDASNSISLQSLLKRINQNSYKALENILEL
jgi:hypothetical protein